MICRGIQFPMIIGDKPGFELLQGTIPAFLYRNKAEEWAYNHPGMTP
jgi:hypothetical protein